MKSNYYSGFTVIEVIVVMIVIAILAIAVIPKFIDLTSDATKKNADSISSALNSASSLNYTLWRSESNKATSVTNCQHVKNALNALSPSNPFPESDYTIENKAVSANSAVTCTITNIASPSITATFVVYGTT